MTEPIIKVHNLGKKYRIGSKVDPKGLDNFRDIILNTVKAPFRNLRRLRKLTNFEDGNDGAANDIIWALKGVSFEINKGEVVGIIGRNGSGKSTLLKILSRITEPTEGFAEIRGRVASLLEVGTGFHRDLTGRENIYLNGSILGMKKWEIDAKFDEIVAFSEIEKFIDTPVKHYSSGMYVRLAFAVAAHLEPEILLVDEVLAVGDAAFQKKCLGKMGDVAKEGKTVIFVSHNMGAISQLCKKGLVLEKGEIKLFSNTQDAIQIYNHSVLAKGNNDSNWPSHILFRIKDIDHNDFAITQIEILDKNGKPKGIVSTWDDVVFRIQYHCKRYIERGSVVLELCTFEGYKLFLLSTQPDGTLPLHFEVGSHAVECIVEKFPFASGEYIIGAGLAIPQVEWLWHKTELGRLTVMPRDVYDSGLAPTAARALIAVGHFWRKVKC